MEIAEPRSKYMQVADQLRDEINRGKYGPGELLPSQPRLAERFRISQTLVSKAIRVLAREGLVRTTSTGSRVRPLKVMTRRAMRRTTTASREAQDARGPFEAEVRHNKHVPRVDLVKSGQEEAPQEAATALALKEGAPVAVRRRHMFADDYPVLLATSYVPWNLAEGTEILAEDPGKGGIYTLLAKRGHGPARFTELVKLRSPTPHEADFLKLNEGQLVYVIRRVAWDANDRPVEVNIQILPPHQWELQYDWPAEGVHPPTP